MKKTPDLYDLIRADQVRAGQRVPRPGNSPFNRPEPMPRTSYADPTATTAINNVDRERRKQNKTPR